MGYSIGIGKLMRYLYLCVYLALGMGQVLLLSSCTLKQPPKVTRSVLTESDLSQYEAKLTQLLNNKYGKRSDHAAASAVALVLKTLKADDYYSVILLPTPRHICIAGVQSRVYLSYGLLDVIQYENELAFLLARELYILRSRLIADRIEYLGLRDHLKIEDLFEGQKIYQLDRLKALEADRMAIRALYGANYDPRGGVSLMMRILSKSLDSSDPEVKVLPSVEDRLEAIRDEIAKLSPLRTPIVSSAEFRRYVTGR
jgi:predicted Zn-dependent protease